MAIWNDDLLNKPNGDIDYDYVAWATQTRAEFILKSVNVPLDYFLESFSFLDDRAAIFRTRIRAKLGLPDDRVMIPMTADIAADLAKSGVQWEI